MSAGFIEPLESNGLFSVHSFLEKLVKVLLSGSINQYDRDVYDTAVRGMFHNFAEFVALHYAFSKRDDTPYWRANTDRVYDKTMADLTPTIAVGFFDYQNQKMFKANIDINGGLIWIATGMNHHVIDQLNAKSVEFTNNIDTKTLFAEAFTKVEINKQRWWTAAKNELSLAEYLRKFIHKGE